MEFFEGEVMVAVVGEDKVTEDSIEGEEEAIGVDVASLPPKERVEVKFEDVDVTEAGGAVEVDGGGGRESRLSSSSSWLLSHSGSSRLAPVS